MNRVPPPRKLKKQPRKCFGVHSRIVDAEAVAAGTTKGKRVGDKQLDPSAYKHGYTDHRNRTEIVNAEARARSCYAVVGCPVCPHRAHRPGCKPKAPKWPVTAVGSFVNGDPDVVIKINSPADAGDVLETLMIRGCDSITIQ